MLTLILIKLSLTVTDQQTCEFTNGLSTCRLSLQSADLDIRILFTKQGAPRERALEFLSSINEEQVLQLALMADAADEEMSLQLGPNLTDNNCEL